ncbi:MAG: ferrochelatase [Bacteroidota bacterium]
MTPQAYLRWFRPDRRLLTGSTFETTPLAIEQGDVVGVVVLGLGGPSEPDEAATFLYSRLMDPVEADLRVPRVLRHRVASVLARRWGQKLRKAFELIGGSSPLCRHAQEQASALERRLNDRYGAATGARFRSYVAMRHGSPSMEEAQRRMAADGVTKVVLLPLQPQYAASTTGSALSHWTAALDGRQPWPTTLVAEYATHPKLVRAFSERVEEALQRFPREARSSVQILFTAHGTPRRHLTQYEDRYCCHVEATVQAVLAERGESGRPVQIAYRRPFGGGQPRGLSLADALADLSTDGSTALLLVPVSYLSDRIETDFDLDVTARAEAAEAGVTAFEVSNGLNGHALLIEALAETVASRLLPAAFQGDGFASVEPPSLARPHTEAARVCSVCGRSTHTQTWPALPDPTVAEPTEPQRTAA